MPRRPNIIFILADDLGWADLSCYGRPDYVTPHLDQLATQGVRLTDCYSASATCSPTRIALMTGRYPTRHPAGLPEPILPEWPGGEVGLEPEFPALPALLKQAGYRTGLVGKWHCGPAPSYGPLLSGFDEYFGIDGAGAGYFSHLDQYGDAQFYEGDAPISVNGYMTDLLTERACDFIERNQGDPFYLSLHYTAPHWPWEAPYDLEKSATKVPDTNGGSIETFGAMVRSLDAGVGRVMATLAELKLDHNTLVVFTSDNGGERYSYQYPLTGHIRLLREGGIRVPGIARWTGTIPAGQVIGQPVVTMDWTATFLACAGTRADTAYPPDGLDLLDLLSGEGESFGRTLFWRTMRMDAARRGPWKYWRNLDTGQESLFNLVRDIREYNDFRESHPEIFESLKAEFLAWESTTLTRPEVQPLSKTPSLNFQIF
jgi:arylsulfatase A-like enzyme